MVTIPGALDVNGLPLGASVAVFTVPIGRALVLTDVRSPYGWGLQLVEDAGGTLTVRRELFDASNGSSDMPGPTASGSAGVGAAFASGSVVRIRNTYAASGAYGRYELIGYLAQP